jgi:hypothetical protein
MAAGDGPPLRRCPHCGAETRTRFERCPECDGSYFTRPPRFGRTTKLVVAAVLVAVVGVVAAVLAVDIHDSKRERSASDRAARARLVARERVRMTREQTPRRGRPAGLRPPPAGATRAQQVAARRALVAALQDAIVVDAGERARRGQLDRRATSATCGPLSPTAAVRNEQDDPSRPVGRYDCVATTRLAREGGRVVGRFGYDYVATVDFRRFSWVLCLNHPPPSEAGVPLVQVRLSRACLGLGRSATPIGSGYLAPSGG